MGLDVGTSTVKYVQLKQKGKLTKLIGYGKIDIPENTIIEGIISEPEKLGTALKKAFKNPSWGKISAKRIIASLPEAHLFTRIIELPKLNEKDIEEAVKYEVDQSFPIPATDLYLDWETINQTQDKTTVLLAAAPRSIVDSYVQLFKEIEMEPLALEVSLASIARAMVSNKDLTEPVVIVDIGGTTSNIAVFDSNLRVTGSYPIGGQTIINNLISGLNINSKTAEAIINKGLKGEDKNTALLKNELENLTIEVKKVMNYFYEQNQKNVIKKALICGGLAYLPGLPEYFKEKLEIEAKVGNPWVNISIYPLKPVPKEEAASYAAAIGLSMRGLRDE